MCFARAHVWLVESAFYSSSSFFITRVSYILKPNSLYHNFTLTSGRLTVPFSRRNLGFCAGVLGYARDKCIPEGSVAAVAAGMLPLLALSSSWTRTAVAMGAVHFVARPIYDPYTGDEYIRVDHLIFERSRSSSRSSGVSSISHASDFAGPDAGADGANGAVDLVRENVAGDDVRVDEDRRNVPSPGPSVEEAAAFRGDDEVAFAGALENLALDVPCAAGGQACVARAKNTDAATDAVLALDSAARRIDGL